MRTLDQAVILFYDIGANLTMILLTIIYLLSTIFLTLINKMGISTYLNGKNIYKSLLLLSMLLNIKIQRI